MATTLGAGVVGFLLGAGLAGAIAEKQPDGSYRITFQLFKIKSTRAVSVPSTDMVQLFPDVQRGMVFIKSDSSNADKVFVGLPPVTRDTGYMLGVGEELVIVAENLDNLHAIANSGWQRLKVIVYGLE